MRLVSLKLQNYRIHRALEVSFDPARTLIGGPNETGKSTLVEAVHRALFLKSKGNTEYHRQMLSLQGGQPEVEVVFEARGRIYTLRKRFGGNGTTNLIPDRGTAISGEEAEAQLAAVLAVEAGVSGRALAGQWAHLWVWQGKSGLDPFAESVAQKDALLQRLQGLGAAAVLQSALDARVAALFAEQAAEVVTQAGKPKAGSDWERAEAEAERAGEALSAARQRLESLGAAAVDLQAARQEVPLLEEARKRLGQEQAGIEARAGQVRELQQEEAMARRTCEDAATRLAQARSAQQKILTTSARRTKLADTLRPRQEALAGLQAEMAATRELAALADGRLADAQKAARQAHLDKEALEAQRDCLLARVALTDAEGKWKRVGEVREQRARLEQEVARLPKLDAAGLQKLRKLETAVNEARAAVAAMSATVEVMSADLPVQVAGVPLEIGAARRIEEIAEVLIGSGVRLRIAPGGGTTLADTRAALAAAEAKLRAELDRIGVDSLTAAVEAGAQREDLLGRIKALGAQLDGMDAEQAESALARAREHHAEKEALIQRTVERGARMSAGESLEVVRAALVEAEEILHREEKEAVAAEAKRAELRKRCAERESAVERQRVEVEKEAQELRELEAELRVFTEAHGNEADRSARLLELEVEEQASRERWTALQSRIAALQPESLDRDLARVKRALEENAERSRQIERRIAEAETRLHSDGGEDPHAAMASAAAWMQRAEAQRSQARTHKDAVVLLRDLFREEERALADHFTRPLADKVSAYLQCLFGAGAKAVVSLDEHGFTGLQLARDGEAHSFESLSGGAREQAAAAVRLAMAEVLAADHEGCLPIVFDDAFAYADPERVQRLQRMLDLAASRGLQVIVLTCTPHDYAALGAREISLR